MRPFFFLAFLLLCSVSLFAQHTACHVCDIDTFFMTTATSSRFSPDDLVSRAQLLLGVPYAANTLGGGPGMLESFVARCDSLDCMLLLELALASGDSILCADSLRAQRYDRRVCAWSNRLHFFSDWIERGPHLQDVGADIPGAVAVSRSINYRQDGTRWLQGVQCSERTLYRIHADSTALRYLHTGDLVGIWSEQTGLDVSHVGILVWQQDELQLLHASSSAGCVIQQPLLEYPNLKRGLLVLRLPE